MKGVSRLHEKVSRQLFAPLFPRWPEDEVPIGHVTNGVHYTPEVGWALGDGQEHGSDSAWDAVEANALYDLLEREVIPEFYARDPNGIPAAWVARMRESMAQLTPRFAADRTVREYTEQHYLPAATGYHERTANKGALAKRMLACQQDIDQKWGSLRFGGRHVETTADHHLFEVEIFLNDLGKNAARVELYADAINGGGPVRQEMKWERLLPGAPEGCVYQATVPAARPAGDYTARVIPQSDVTSVPLEDTRILWQR